MDDDFRRALDHLVADTLAEDAARDRSQERVLRTVAASEATFLGIALDLAEQATPVVARIASGRTHQGTVVAVGRDFLVLRDGPKAPVFLAAAAVSSLRPRPGWSEGGEPAGARAAPLAVSLATLLAGLAGDRPRVSVVTAGDDPVAGELRAAGLDVLTIRLDGDGRPVVHVQVTALTELVLLDR